MAKETHEHNEKKRRMAKTISQVMATRGTPLLRTIMGVQSSTTLRLRKGACLCRRTERRVCGLPGRTSVATGGGVLVVDQSLSPPGH